MTQSQLPATPNREAVKVLAKAIGLREAARRMGLSEERVLKWSQRDPAGPWGTSLMPPPRLSLSSKACPQPVLTASEALSDSLAEDSRETRLSLSRGARRMSAQVETADMDRAGDALQVAKLASITHGWEVKGPAAAVMVNVNLLGMPVEHLAPADQVLLVDPQDLASDLT